MKRKKSAAIYIVPVLAVFLITIAVILKITLPKPEKQTENPPGNTVSNIQPPQTPEPEQQDSPQMDPTPSPEPEPQPDPSPDPEPQPKPEPKPDPEPEPEPEPQGKNFQGGEWSTILCNPSHSLPEGYHEKVKLDYVQGDYRMDYRAAPAMKAMIAAAKEDGIELLLCSTYRTTSYQRQLYENRINIVMNEDPSLSYDEAAVVAATINAIPGTSEHETGLAADIVTPSYQRLNSNFDQTEAYRWLYTHCKEFGFILRYPKEKTDITKIIYEPWHYRFVGTEHSYKIMEQGICYEEYLGILD